MLLERTREMSLLWHFSLAFRHRPVTKFDITMYYRRHQQYLFALSFYRKTIIKWIVIE